MLFVSCVPLMQSCITPLLVSAFWYYYVEIIVESTEPAACYVVLSLPLCLAKCINLYIIEEYRDIFSQVGRKIFLNHYNKQFITN